MLQLISVMNVFVDKRPIYIRTATETDRVHCEYKNLVFS